VVLVLERAPDLDALAADRRTFLAVLAAGVAGVLSGCSAAAGTGAGQADDRAIRTPAAAPVPGLPFPRSPALPLPPVPPPRPGRPRTFRAGPGGVGSGARVALTIDDGASPQTVAGYVDFAQRTGIPLTFSPNGIYRDSWQPHAFALRPLIEAGQVQVCNHTFTHLDMLVSGDSAIRADIERNEDWIQQVFGTTARPWLRPPFGRHSRRTDEVAGEAGYTRILMWEGSFGDARLLTPRVWMEQARQWLTGGRIILGHANHPTVTHLFDQLLALIRQRRLEPVTLDTMFGTSRATG
jgi:peptidoglycan-N-acetylglucosamine deacetylase